VAIKVIAREFTLDAGLLERFYREVQSARRISHPNVCRILDWKHRHAVPSMELLEGEISETPERGPLPPEEWEEKTVSSMDSARLMASDRSSRSRSSIWMIVGSRLVILDFRLARGGHYDDSSLTHTGMLMGADWMAPEQLLANSTSAAICLRGVGPAASAARKAFRMKVRVAGAASHWRYRFSAAARIE
jgi:hypothetical protein